MRLRNRMLLMGSIPFVVVPLGWHLRPVVVVGNSMTPTLHNGQVVWMRRWHEGMPLHRGDIVVFRTDNGVCVKRVMALAGETVPRLRFSGGSYLFPDEVPVSLHDCLRKMLHRKVVKHDDLRVPASRVYVVGDNRTSSCDSRDFGPVPTDRVFGVLPDIPRVQSRSLLARNAD